MKGKKRKATAHLPVKKSINLAVIDEQKLSIPGAIIGIILVLVLAGTFSKIFVIDRLVEMQRKEKQAEQLERQVQECYDRLEELVEVKDNYAHYTLDNMTSEELNRCDRVSIVRLIQEKILGQYSGISWTVAGNTLTLSLTGESLQQINTLCKQIEESPIVSFCTVASAEKKVSTSTDKTTNTQSTTEVVKATINAYLQIAANDEDSSESEAKDASESEAQDVSGSETQGSTESTAGDSADTTDSTAS